MGDGSTTSDRNELSGQHAMLLRGITKRLEGEFGDHFTRDTLQHYVEDSYDELASKARVLTHIPSFVERFSRQRLRAIAKNTGLVDDHIPQVLFVCQRNDATSQMAAAIFNDRVDDRAHADSAGAQPAAELVDTAVLALHEIGIDILGEFPKPITEEIERAADVIVTLDDHDDIPVIDDRHYEAWTFDRSELDAEGYRSLLDELQQKVDKLIEQVVPHRQRTHTAFDQDLTELEALVREMGDAVIVLVGRLGPAIDHRSAEELQQIIDADDPIDELELQIHQKVIESIVRRQPVAQDLRTILAMHDTGIHLERVADGVVDVAMLALDDELTDPEDDVGTMIDLVASMTTGSLAALLDRDTELAYDIEKSDNALGDRYDAIFTRLIENGSGPSGPAHALRLDRAARLLKRSGEHALDIAEQAVFLVTGQHIELGRRVGRPIS